MTTSLDQKKVLNRKINFNMRIATWINLTIGLITIVIAIFSIPYRAFMLPGVASLSWGFYYAYREQRLKREAWQHLDVLVILLIINLFCGAIVPVVFIFFAIKERHQINKLSGKSYMK
uniref:hypothetical protein n=1 Tax=Lactobacillus crispatus TaxID=47770 RepID=UPI0021BCFB8A|nr:hypothetical protein [Lactobacillus crispatus]